jgi:putative transport protein
MAASPTLLLQPGDEVRVVSDRTRITVLNALFGNSTTALSESCYLTFVMGIVLGLLVGMIPIPIPGLSAPLHLGMAGGPLIVGILLDWLGRTGPLVWSMPHEINLGIRHFGLLLFLAAAGANAGASLPSALEREGVSLILFAVIVVLVTHAIAWLVLKMAGERDLPTILGVLSGLQTQPAALSFAAARVEAEKVQIGYTSVYPLAIILKIILAQLLLELAKRLTPDTKRTSRMITAALSDYMYDQGWISKDQKLTPKMSE